MVNCVFCKVVRGEIPSVKVWEDEGSLAILDINPNTKGMTLVLTKKHYDSYVVKMDDSVYAKFFLAAKKVASLLEKGLGVRRVALVMEGMGVDHAHIKLYPMHGLGQEFKEMWAQDRVFFEKYEGYITTKIGHQKTPAELEEVAEKIRKNI